MHYDLEDTESNVVSLGFIVSCLEVVPTDDLRWRGGSDNGGSGATMISPKPCDLKIPNYT